jgi:CRP/FNR family cyclic AMP-dependent transcriptional regulator
MFGRWRTRSNQQVAANETNKREEGGTAAVATDQYARILGQVPLFIDLSSRELQRLGAACRQQDYPAGDVLLRQGEPGDTLFVIVSGRVQVTRHGDDVTSHGLATAGPGEVVGDMALLDDLPHSATVTALEPTRVLAMPVSDFRAALREEPDITIRLLATVSRRLRRAEARQI